jgi:SAM-dependent methyltransferase
MACDARASVSPWIRQWAGLVPTGTPVLDVAAGAGRHALFFAERGHPVTAVDRDVDRLPSHPGIEVVGADLENGSPWPLPERRFGAVVVTNYLHRPLMPTLLAAVAPQGVLLYETFMEGNERFGKPSRPAFLLKDGETSIAYHIGFDRAILQLVGEPAGGTPLDALNQVEAHAAVAHLVELLPHVGDAVAAESGARAQHAIVADGDVLGHGDLASFGARAGRRDGGPGEGRGGRPD